ncbi:MFS transporter [Haloplanus halophilus]|uniref:MFS transporter n=1 Tax=Haloplanus halophilus TaxID=2949993 RepID=UPI00203C53A1|nr:MFS transporter [Haloplanus sp. GDY1]
MSQLSSGGWDERHTALSVCVGSYFAVRLAQLLVSPVVPSLRETFGVTSGTVGAVLTGMWLVYAVTQLPSGAAGDRYGPRRVVLAALACTAVGAVALAAAPSLLAFAAFALLLGAGAGLYYTPATALLTDRFDATGGVIGVHRVGGQVAGLAAPVLATLLGARFGWRGVVGSGALVAAALVAVVVAGREGERPTATTDGGRTVDPRALVGVLSRPPVAFAVFLAVVGEFAALATVSLLPVFLVDHHGLSMARAGLLFSAYFVVVAAFQPVSGRASDLVGRETVVAVLFAAGAAGYATLALTTRLALAAPAVALVGAAMAWGPPVQSRAVDALADAERGVGFGLFRTGYILLGALGPLVVGSTADAAGWAVAVGLLAGLLGLTAAVLVLDRLVARKRRPLGSSAFGLFVAAQDGDGGGGPA